MIQPIISLIRMMHSEVSDLEKLIQGELSSRLGLPSLPTGTAPKGTKGLPPGFK